MKRIVLLSDTHGYLDTRFIGHLRDSDEIWHAGDIGSPDVAEQLSSMRPFRAVHGNIDGQQLKVAYPVNLLFQCEDVPVWITHIGGYPGHYEKKVMEKMIINQPELFICGHSHILKIMYDKYYRLLYVNPGAAGKYGFHTVQTLVKFSIEKDRIFDMEVVELKRN